MYDKLLISNPILYLIRALGKSAFQGGRKGRVSLLWAIDYGNVRIAQKLETRHMFQLMPIACEEFTGTKKFFLNIFLSTIDFATPGLKPDMARGQSFHDIKRSI